MKKYIADEKTVIRYTLQGDYCIPDLILPLETDDRPIGIWGRRNRNYLTKKKRHSI